MAYGFAVTVIHTYFQEQLFVNRRRFLTAKEVQAMMQAARQGPTGERDYCLILLAFRHGMRISELLDLHYHDLDLHEGGGLMCGD